MNPMEDNHYTIILMANNSDHLIGLTNHSNMQSRLHIKGSWGRNGVKLVIEVLKT